MVRGLAMKRIVFCLVALCCTAAAAAGPQDDKRIQELENRVAILEKKLAALEKLLLPAMALGMAKSHYASNERNASTTLKTFCSAQAYFRANDRDGNRVNDYWSADVSGLYRITIPLGRGKGEAIRLIERLGATADAHPVISLEKAGQLQSAEGLHASGFVALGKPSPKAGYWFAAVKSYEDEQGNVKKYNTGNGRNLSRFGITAYPAEYGKTGKRTFVVNEGNTVFWKDTNGAAPKVISFDLVKAGWRRLD